MIYNKFINCSTRSVFNTNLAAGNITNQHIVFIQDTKEIWTSGVFYSGVDESVAEKLALILTDGNGSKYLSDDGTYKSVQANPEIYIGPDAPTEDFYTMWIDDSDPEVTESLYHFTVAKIPTESDSDYKIGTEMRYLDPEGKPHFYKLYSITNEGKANWVEILNLDDKNEMNKILEFYNTGISVNTLANLPVTSQSVYAEVTQPTTLTLAGPLKVGRSLSILIKNVSTAAITQPIPSSDPYTNMGPSSLVIAAGKYAEINIWAYTEGKYNIRTGEMYNN